MDKLIQRAGDILYLIQTSKIDRNIDKIILELIGSAEKVIGLNDYDKVEGLLEDIQIWCKIRGNYFTNFDLDRRLSNVKFKIINYSNK